MPNHMSRSKRNRNQHRYYKKESFGKSVFDGKPTLIINHYIVPTAYKDAVSDVLTAFHNGIPFNRAVDQVATLNPSHINRDKLATHTLKYIANDY